MVSKVLNSPIKLLPPATQMSYRLFCMPIPRRSDGGIELSLLPQPDLTITWQLEQTVPFHWATIMLDRAIMWQSNDKSQLVEQYM
jgi:hypothetical protein